MEKILIRSRPGTSSGNSKKHNKKSLIDAAEIAQNRELKNKAVIIDRFLACSKKHSPKLLNKCSFIFIMFTSIDKACVRYQRATN